MTKSPLQQTPLLPENNGDFLPNAQITQTLDIAPSDDTDWASASHMRTLVLMAATVIGAYFCYAMAAPFMPAITGAFALAVLFAPMQTWLEAKVKSANFAAAIAVLAIALIVVVPASFVAQRLVREAASGAQLIDAKVESGEWRRNLAAQPTLAPIAAKVESELDLPGAIKSFNTWLTGAAGALVRGSLIQVIGLAMTGAI